MKEEIWFDPALRELFLRTTGRGWEQAADLPQIEISVVAKLRNPDNVVPGLRLVSRFGQVVTGRAELNRLIEIRRHPEVLSLKASRDHYESLLASTADIGAAAARLETIDGAAVSGRGVVVAIVDWGCDFAHTNFRHKNGQTRLIAFWDQRGPRSGQSPEPYGYGREFDATLINSALAAEDPYAALDYDPDDADAGGGTHGTHVMDIAAGNGFATGAAAGVAPEADLIFVHLRGNDTTPRQTLGDSVRLLEAVRYVKDRAAGRPVVMNLSLGRTGGPKDGSTLVEQALDSLLREGPGCAIVMSTGNYYRAGLHAAGKLRAGETVDLRWRVNARHEETAEMEVWYSGSDRFQAELLDPQGDPFLKAALGEEGTARRGDHVLGSLYHRERDPNNGDHQINLFLWPQAPVGTWTLRLSAEQAVDGRFDAYIERDDPEYQSRFLPENVEESGTTNTICNGVLTIAVGAYDASRSGNPIVDFSSAGPTRDLRRKPDCSAPGFAIQAARSAWWNGERMERDGLVRKSGTSMAAPHVTGTVALMFEAASGYAMPVEVTRMLLLQSCRRPESSGSGADFRYGAGMVDTLAAVRGARQWKMQMQSSDLEGEDAEVSPMSLIDSVRKICDRLAPQGWRELLLKHGLDIKAADLEKELARSPLKIDRSITGFEDFAMEGTRGIEPGQPSHSLLYHALACSGVVKDASGGNLKVFPTMAEINTVENFIFAARGVSWEDLKRQYGADLSIVVFTSEYRQLQRSVHRKHAELCFSRTGVAHAGTAGPRYVAQVRSFSPLTEEDPRNTHVTPARYCAYVAVKKKGGGQGGPVHSRPGDGSLEFWLPVHKLFSGKECLKGLDLKIQLRMCHYNEKIKRLREYLGQTAGVDLNKPPFVVTNGIAEWGDEKQFGPGWVMPVKHDRLVAIAKLAGKIVTYKVDPAKLPSRIWSSYGVATSEDAQGLLLRKAPEWLNCRFVEKPGGGIADLAERVDKDIEAIVAAGGYDAVHFADFTGEGWVDAAITPLPGAKVTVRPAYSLVAAPDFFPFCDQLQLTEWLEGSGAWKVPPRALCDTRLPMNLQVPGNLFEAGDKTGTAVVSMPYDKTPAAANRAKGRRRGASWLPDAAAGVFAPGWDVSLDAKGANTHLAHYGLGSPFPEDAQLCAALSAFWPAVAPDTARKNEPYGTKHSVAPLTDDELGDGSKPGFDGYGGPKLLTVGSTRYVEVPRGAYVDYVKSALEGRFNFHLTSKVNFLEYKRRVLAMFRAYGRLGANSSSEKAAWLVVSFKQADPSDAEFQRHQRTARVTLSNPSYRILVAKGKWETIVPAQRTRRMEVAMLKVVYVNPDVASEVLMVDM